MTTPANPPADLVTWLRAQLDDEATWPDVSATWNGMCDAPGVHLDADRWRAEVDAKRRILDDLERQMHAAPAAPADPDAAGWVEGIRTQAEGIAALLALPYADRPGYLEEWRPA